MHPIMPSLFRFVRLALCAAAALTLAMWLLATFVTPEPRPTSLIIPLESPHL